MTLKEHLFRGGVGMLVCFATEKFATLPTKVFVQIHQMDCGQNLLVNYK